MPQENPKTQVENRTWGTRPPRTEVVDQYRSEESKKAQNSHENEYVRNEPRKVTKDDSSVSCEGASLFECSEAKIHGRNRKEG